MTMIPAGCCLLPETKRERHNRDRFPDLPGRKFPLICPAPAAGAPTISEPNQSFEKIRFDFTIIPVHAGDWTDTGMTKEQKTQNPVTYPVGVNGEKIEPTFIRSIGSTELLVGQSIAGTALPQKLWDLPTYVIQQGGMDMRLTVEQVEKLVGGSPAAMGSGELFEEGTIYHDTLELSTSCDKLLTEQIHLTVNGMPVRSAIQTKHDVYSSQATFTVDLEAVPWARDIQPGASGVTPAPAKGYPYRTMTAAGYDADGRMKAAALTRQIP